MAAGQINKTQVLRRYFGMRPGDQLTDFVKELKALNGAERLELAQLAAKELGLAPSQLDFSMS